MEVGVDEADLVVEVHIRGAVPGGERPAERPVDALETIEVRAHDLAVLGRFHEHDGEATLFGEAHGRVEQRGVEGEVLVEGAAGMAVVAQVVHHRARLLSLGVNAVDRMEEVVHRRERELRQIVLVVLQPGRHEVEDAGQDALGVARVLAVACHEPAQRGAQHHEPAASDLAIDECGRVAEPRLIHAEYDDAAGTRQIVDDRHALTQGLLVRPEVVHHHRDSRALLQHLGHAGLADDAHAHVRPAQEVDGGAPRGLQLEMPDLVGDVAPVVGRLPQEMRFGHEGEQPAGHEVLKPDQSQPGEGQSGQ